MHTVPFRGTLIVLSIPWDSITSSLSDRATQTAHLRWRNSVNPPISLISSKKILATFVYFEEPQTCLAGKISSSAGEEKSWRYTGEYLLNIIEIQWNDKFCVDTGIYPNFFNQPSNAGKQRITDGDDDVFKHRCIESLTGWTKLSAA